MKLSKPIGLSLACVFLFACGGDGADGVDGVDGDAGQTSLVSTTAEPAGENCADGGTRIDSGIDDIDGTLGASEIDSTSYVCSSTSGTIGTDGTNTLVSVSDEALG